MYFKEVFHILLLLSFFAGLLFILLCNDLGQFFLWPSSNQILVCGCSISYYCCQTKDSSLNDNLTQRIRRELSVERDDMRVFQKFEPDWVSHDCSSLLLQWMSEGCDWLALMPLNRVRLAKRTIDVKLI